MNKPLPPELRPVVTGLGVRIWWLERRIEQYRQAGDAKSLKAAEAELEKFRKERRELRGW